MKLLYCSHKHVYKKNSMYYSTGSFPEFIPQLSKFFDELYLLVPVSSHPAKGISKLKLSKNLKIIETCSFQNRLLRIVHGYMWSFINLRTFLKYQRKADSILIAIPSALVYLPFILLADKPLIAFIAGDEQEVIKASNRIITKFENLAGISKFKLILERRLLNKSAKIICMNNKFKNKILEFNNNLESRINVIPIGIRTDLFRPYTLQEKLEIKEKLEIRSNEIVIGFVSSYISHPKGADCLIKVYNILKKKFPFVRLLLIGELKIAIELDASIINCGFVKREDLPNYYNAMDVFIFPSRSDMAPKVVMEACSCGLPVISTNVGGLSELIVEGKTGYLVDSEDVNNIIRYCERLIIKKELRHFLGQNSREYALRNFDLDRRIAEVANIIRDM